MSNPNNLPKTTVLTVPSYYLFPDGIYPPNYPPHPNPPTQKPIKTAVDYPVTRYPTPPTANEMARVNREIQLYNSQRQLVSIDLVDVATRIRRLHLDR